MKLSDAAVLGDTLRARRSDVWLEPTESGDYCGCWIGGAMRAEGIVGTASHSQAFELWPWLGDMTVDKISIAFSLMCKGLVTEQEVIDTVKALEAEHACEVCGIGKKGECCVVWSTASPTETLAECKRLGESITA